MKKRTTSQSLSFVEVFGLLMLGQLGTLLMPAVSRGQCSEWVETDPPGQLPPPARRSCHGLPLGQWDSTLWWRHAGWAPW